jgi:HD-like signal output (HDOD) protein
MDGWLNNDQVKALVSQLTTVPSVPTVYFQILKELRSPDATLDIVGATIAQDPAMTAKILQLVNSAFFGLAHKLNDPTEAVMHLGMETIKSLVLGIHLFSELQSAKGSQFEMDKIYHHSLATAATAKRIAQLERQPREIVEESFTAGLLHDIGRLVLIANLPDQYAEVVARSHKDSLPLIEAEREVFGATHAETGGYLLGLWGLPVGIVEAALFHHQPRSCKGRDFSALTAVHVANVLQPTQGMDHSAALLPEMDADYLAEAGLTDRASHWMKAFSTGHAE